MSRVFMNIAARRNILFYARLRRGNFFDKLKRSANQFAERFLVYGISRSAAISASICASVPTVMRR